MLKISGANDLQEHILLQLEGRIVGPWVDELRSVCTRIFQRGQSLSICFADIDFIDGPGFALINEVVAQGVALIDCPPFIVEQLKINSEQDA